MCCAVAGNSEKRGCGRGIDSPSGHSRTILPPESLTMLNGNASNNSAMNNGTLERELLNRDRKNSRISAFQPESSLRVVRFVRDERATIPLFTRPSSTTRNDSSSSRRISSPCLVYLPLSSSLCELFINVGESMRPCWILDATAIQSSRKRGEGEAAFSTSCCYSLAFYAVDFMVFPYHRYSFCCSYVTLSL